MIWELPHHLETIYKDHDAVIKIFFLIEFLFVFLFNILKLIDCLNCYLTVHPEWLNTPIQYLINYNV